jgi:hypothetical protein
MAHALKNINFNWHMSLMIAIVVKLEFIPLYIKILNANIIYAEIAIINKVHKIIYKKKLIFKIRKNS